MSDTGSLSSRPFTATSDTWYTSPGIRFVRETWDCDPSTVRIMGVPGKTQEKHDLMHGFHQSKCLKICSMTFNQLFFSLYLQQTACNVFKHSSGFKRTGTRLLGLGCKWFCRSPTGIAVQSRKPQLLCPWYQRNEDPVELQGLPDSNADTDLAVERKSLKKLGNWSTQGPYGH